MGIAREPECPAVVAPSDDVVPLVGRAPLCLQQVFVTQDSRAGTGQGPNVALTTANTVGVRSQVSPAPGLPYDLGDRIIVHKYPRC